MGEQIGSLRGLLRLIGSMVAGCVLVCGLDLALHAAGDDAVMPTLLHLRTPTGFGRELLQQGYTRSSTFRRLVEHLEQAQLLVLIQSGGCADGLFRGCIWTVLSNSHQRTAVIRLDPHDIQDRVVAVLGHELQHAVEIADHPTVVDGPTATAFFGGKHGACDHWAPCETAAAREAERAVWNELRGRTARPTLIAGR